MRYSIFLVFAVLLPVAVAAPVPRDAAKVEFDTNGVLARADLEKVAFDSRLAKDVEPYDGVRERQVEDVCRKPRDAKPRPANRYDVAVHMPWRHFLQNDPIPAYFVLRNNLDHTLSLDARLVLADAEPFTMNSCDITVRNAKTGKKVDVFTRIAMSCGGGGLVEVPADGFYCVKGNLGRTADGEALPPGEYEVDWRYRALRSAPVTFVVAKSDGKPAPRPKRPAYGFFHIREEPSDRDAPGEGEPVTWRETSLDFIVGEDMAAALASGEEAFVPDVHRIPANDKVVEVRAEWRPYRDGDRLAVTLRAAAPHKQVVFNDLPHLYLQVEVPAGQRLEYPLAGQEKLIEKLKSSNIATPLTIEAKLPAGWRDDAGVSGPTRVAVVVTAKELEIPRGWAELKKTEELRKLFDAGETPVWGGVVRAEFTEQRFPPRLPVPLPAP
jgi:hypothetical protein